MVKNNLKLVHCYPLYWEFVRKLRNNSRNMFKNTEFISKEQHKLFMLENYLSYYICLYEEEPVGFIGSVKGDVRLVVKQKMRRKGIGQFMLKELMRLNNNLFTTIRVENKASLDLFLNCGFKIKYHILES